MITAQEILGSHPIELLKKLDLLIEGDWYVWEPEVLLHTINDSLPIQAADKVLAVQAVAANSGMAFKSAAAFDGVIQAFCNNGVESDALQPPHIEEVMYAAPHIMEIAKHVHGDSINADFSPEVAQYVAAVAKYRGWSVLPKRLEFAQNTLNRLTGLHEGTVKYSEFKHAIETVRSLYSGVHGSDFVADDKVLSMIDEDSSDAQTIKKVIGAYVYDPTILYGNKGNQA